MNHLHDKIRLVAESSDQERITSINNYRWIRYRAADDILSQLDELLLYPKQMRMPNMLIVGESNNGKTILVNRFVRLNKPVVTDNKLTAPVIYVQAPTVPDEKKFFENLLDELNAPYRLSDRIERKERQALTAMEIVGAKMLIIDEIHNILAGSFIKQKAFFNVIKNISNQLQIVIVAVGIKEALNAVNTDSQIANRFVPEFLPKWRYNEDYIRLLASFERLLPLRKPSELINEGISKKILEMSDGTIGEISTILSLAAKAAIKSGKERIDTKILTEIKYTKPSERRRAAEKYM